MTRRALQGAVALAGCVPVLAGGAGVLLGAPMLGLPADLTADSHYRYLSGLLLGIGLAFWGMIPRIERQGSGFRLLTLVVVTGGLARLAGLAAGLPKAPMLAALVMELLVTPGLCVWQARVEGRAGG